MDQIIPGYHDPEDSIEFSQPAELPKDSLADMLKDELAPLVTDREEAFRVIDAVLSESSNDHVGADSHEVLCRMLDLLSRYQNTTLALWCMKLILGKDGRSEEEIGNMLGVTKAAVSAMKLQIQDEYGLKSRGGRSVAAREKFRELAIKRGKRRHNTTWTAQHIWSQHLALGSN